MTGLEVTQKKGVEALRSTVHGAMLITRYFAPVLYLLVQLPHWTERMVRSMTLVL